MQRDTPGELLGRPDEPEPELEQLLAEVAESVVHMDANWRVTYCNDSYLQFVGLQRSQVIGKTPFEYAPHFSRSIFHEPAVACQRDRRAVVAIGYSVLQKRWLMARVFPTRTGMLLLANDASEAVVEQYQLAQRAVRDALTGLPNKLSMVQEMKARLGRGEPFALAVLGLNRFKTINDSQGYARGDMALLEVGSLLQSSTLEGEQLYRLNGDEFAVLIRGGDTQLRARMQHLLAQTGRPLLINGQEFVLGAAAGAALAPEHGNDAETLLKRAGLALRQAKRRHRDDVVVYEANLETATRVRMELEAELRHAVEAGQLMLVLQPKGSLAGRHLIGAEALLRWRHPVRGMVSPMHFLPLAQDCGLMRTIDRWVLREVLCQISQLKTHGCAVPVSMNVSVDSLADPAFAQSVREALSETGVEPRLLDIEIPEGALMHDVVTSTRVLADLNRLGVRISIDDFGTGYSSFAYLARFPVHTLKVDRSFVVDMAACEASRRIVEGLIRLAHSLSLHVVAEGAETDEQIAMLHSMSCDTVQGHGYAEPMPVEEFCEFARAHREGSAALSP